MLEREKEEYFGRGKTLFDIQYEMARANEKRLGQIEAMLFLMEPLLKNKREKEQEEWDVVADCILSGKVPWDDQEENKDLLFFSKTYEKLDSDKAAEHIVQESEFMHCRFGYFDKHSPAFLAIKERELKKIRKEREQKDRKGEGTRLSKEKTKR